MLAGMHTHWLHALRHACRWLAWMDCTRNGAYKCLAAGAHRRLISGSWVGPKLGSSPRKSCRSVSTAAVLAVRFSYCSGGALRAPLHHAVRILHRSGTRLAMPLHRLQQPRQQSYLVGHA